MKLYSTNDNKNIVELKEAVLNAFPKDRGLYMPLSFPKLDDRFLLNLEQMSFVDISCEIFSSLVQDYISDADIQNIITKALDFHIEYIELDKNLAVLELFHGPSLAFKDFGARFMAELMSHFLKSDNSKRTILVATSGDTGGAVAAGFHKVDNIDVVILYPSGKVSALQEKQLCCWGDNIRAVEIDGSFDDCQALVKEAFLDDELQSKYTFSSANSINIARLIPQSFYYFEGYKHACKHSDSIVYAVPSGNFGNLTAGLIAQKMGLPIKRFIAATNINDTVPSYLETGHYVPKASVQTISNAMDVGDPSNFKRLLALHGSTWNMVKENVIGISITDEETRSCMKKVYNEHNYILDPHGAVGIKAVNKYHQQNSNDLCVVLETAHPSKFESTVEETLETKISIPQRLESFRHKDKYSILCSKHFADFKELLMFE